MVCFLAIKLIENVQNLVAGADFGPFFSGKVMFSVVFSRAVYVRGFAGTLAKPLGAKHSWHRLVAWEGCFSAENHSA